MTAKKDDLITRISLVDVSKPRDKVYDPVGEGETLLGVMSENLQKLDLLR